MAKPKDSIEVKCEWYALCDRPADGVVEHPALSDGVEYDEAWDPYLDERDVE